MKVILTALATAFLLLVSACTPKREFVRFQDAGTFRPTPQHGIEKIIAPEGEYDSYELIDHGSVPNHGIPPMYANPYSGYGHPASGGYPNRW